MATLFRGILRLSVSVESGTKIFNSTPRCFYSTARGVKIVQGANGEQIIYSPYEDTVYPDITVPEYVWGNVNKYSNKVALECGLTGRYYTYGQARDNANYIARSLLQLGIKSGDIVALVLPNLPETPIAFLACLEAGVIVTTCNPTYTVDEMSKQLLTSKAKAIITTAEIASAVAKSAKSSLPPNAPFIVVDDGTQPIPSDAIPFNDLIVRGKSLPKVPLPIRTPQDIAVLPFSSGTTGLPKGVMLSHENLVSNMEMFETTAAGDIFLDSSDEQDVLPSILPMFHIFGMNSVMFPRLAKGAKLITLPKFTTENYVSILEKHKVTGLVLVPPILLLLTSSNIFKKHHLKHVKFVVSGAAPLSDTDVERFLDKFQSPIKCCQGYGLTESSPLAFIEKSGKKYASIGKPASSCRVRLVDLNTQKDIAEPQKPGELWLSGPHIMKGYFNNEKATNETLENGWLKTGDLAYFDESGDFFICDRLKELIKVKGFQVAPAELEGLLRTHPSIAEAAVIGVRDEKMGEVPKAFVQLKKGKTISEGEIKDFMKGKVSDFKELRGGVTFLDEIPKNPTGKILRSKLKELYAK